MSRAGQQHLLAGLGFFSSEPPLKRKSNSRRPRPFQVSSPGVLGLSTTKPTLLMSPGLAACVDEAGERLREIGLDFPHGIINDAVKVLSS